MTSIKKNEGIFINYREVHDNFQLSEDYEFRETVDIFQRGHIGCVDFPRLL